MALPKTRQSTRWSQWFLRAVLALVVLALSAFGVFQIYLLRSMAPLSGDAPLSGLSAGVEIKRDASDVTHIHAKTPMDAWRAIGYVHAQERGWQLAFNRQVMHGELSEWLGAPTLETDKLMRTLGIMKAAQAQFDKLPPNTQKALQAYAEGTSGLCQRAMACTRIRTLRNQSVNGHEALDCRRQRRLGSHDGFRFRWQLGQ